MKIFYLNIIAYLKPDFCPRPSGLNTYYKGIASFLKAYQKDKTNIFETKNNLLVRNIHCKSLKIPVYIFLQDTVCFNAIC